MWASGIEAKGFHRIQTLYNADARCANHTGCKEKSHAMVPSPSNIHNSSGPVGTAAHTNKGNYSGNDRHK
jgi:hypothetical protein